MLTYTVANLKEIAACSFDFEYFVKAAGYKFTKEQTALAKNLKQETKNIVFASRQSGLSTVFHLFALWHIIFKSDHLVFYGQHSANSAASHIRKISELFNNLPKFLKNEKSIVCNDRFNFKLDNGSAIYASVVNNNVMVGYSPETIILDDFGFVPTDPARTFWATICPQFLYNTKIVLGTTEEKLPPQNELYNELLMESMANKNEFEFNILRREDAN